MPYTPSWEGPQACLCLPMLNFYLFCKNAQEDILAPRSDGKLPQWTFKTMKVLETLTWRRNEGPSQLSNQAAIVISKSMWEVMKKSRGKKENKMIHSSIETGESTQPKANSIANSLPEFGNPTAGISFFFPLPLITKKWCWQYPMKTCEALVWQIIRAEQSDHLG